MQRGWETNVWFSSLSSGKKQGHGVGKDSSGVANQLANPHAIFIHPPHGVEICLCVYEKCILSQVLVAHTCNPSYLGRKIGRPGQKFHETLSQPIAGHRHVPIIPHLSYAGG
jgi:hypothetical protein